MKVAIIEDEITTAEHLAKALAGLSYPVEIIIILTSITEAVNFFKSNYSTNLIYCNVKLGNDDSFNIFKRVKINVPVIYYADDNALAWEAYQYNAINFLLKPVTQQALINSVENYKTLQAGFNYLETNSKTLLTELPQKTNRDSSLIITWKDKIIPVKIKDIALFNIEYKMSQAVTFTNRKYFITNTLEDLEEVCGTGFYRANRQFLVNREAVAEASQHFARKLVLKLKIEAEYEIIISKNRVPEFLSWLRE